MFGLLMTSDMYMMTVRGLYCLQFLIAVVMEYRIEVGQRHILAKKV